MLYREIISKLKSLANPKNVAGMARFGINPKNTLGISIPHLRALAKETGRNHSLARQLWASGIHEARLLAGMIDQPEKVTEKQMDKWARDFDSWDVCDGACMNLFDRLDCAPKKAAEWSKRKEEFVKRAGFALMACLAWHRPCASYPTMKIGGLVASTNGAQRVQHWSGPRRDREHPPERNELSRRQRTGGQDMPDREFIRFLPLIKRESTDNRNFVKKAVNWALRQIGKRNPYLNKQAVKAAQEIGKIDSGAARWIASDAIRELTGPAVQRRLRPVRSEQ